MLVLETPPTRTLGGVSEPQATGTATGSATGTGSLTGTGTLVVLDPSHWHWQLALTFDHLRTVTAQKYIHQ